MWEQFFSTYNVNVSPPDFTQFTKKSLERSNYDIFDQVQYNPNAFSNENEEMNFISTDSTLGTASNTNNNSFSAQSTSVSNTSARESFVNNVINSGRQLSGTPYLNGSGDPKKGLDCGWFLHEICRRNNFYLSPSCYDIKKVGREVSFNDLRVGDILVTPGNGKTGLHVAMVSSMRDGKIKTIESKGGGKGVGEYDFTKPVSKIITIRRIFDDDGYISKGNKLSYPQLKAAVSSTTSTTSAKDPNNPITRIDIEDLLKSEGITSVNGKKIKFGNRAPRAKNASYGVKNSWHKKADPHTGYAMARDISIPGGNQDDYAEFRRILLNNPRVREYFAAKGWGIINEITSAALKRTNGTGPHFHFGPDQWARRTWAAWLRDPNINVATIIPK